MVAVCRFEKERQRTDFFLKLWLSLQVTGGKEENSNFSQESNLVVVTGSPVHYVLMGKTSVLLRAVVSYEFPFNNAGSYLFLVTF